MFRKVDSFMAWSAAALLASLVIAGCGSSGGSSNSGALPANVAVRVGSTEISKPTLNHWMATIIGGDIFEISGLRAPVGLVSEPANYPACVVGLKTLTHNPKSKVEPSNAVLNLKCQQFESAVKKQAVEYLISAEVIRQRAAESGVKVSEGEVQQQFKVLRAEQFPTEAELRTYLAQRHWSLSDELFLLKKDMLSTRLHVALQKKFADSGGEEVLIRYSHASSARWVTKTDCRPGYVAEGCKQFKSGVTATSGPSANILIEEIEKLRENAGLASPVLKG